jgi:alpha-L-arabinofuranosidase
MTNKNQAWLTASKPKILILSAIFLATAILAPMVSSAQTIAELKVLIGELLHQVQTLQAQLKEKLSVPSSQVNGKDFSAPDSDFSVSNPPDNKSPTTAALRPLYCYLPIHYLRLGQSDAETEGEVSKLQRFLSQYPDIYPEGLITGYFGALTQKAVQRWQASRAVVSSGSPETTGFGIVGPKTALSIKNVCRKKKDTAVIRVDASKVTETIPDALFGINTPQCQKALFNIVSPDDGRVLDAERLEALAKIKPSFFRYPGGTPAIHYFWNNEDRTYTPQSWCDSTVPRQFLEQEEYYQLTKNLNIKSVLQLNTLEYLDEYNVFDSEDSIPFAGDWNGDGTDETGIRISSGDSGKFYIDTNADGRWNGESLDSVYTFGSSSDKPITGDWNGDGKDEIGIWRADGNVGKFYLDLDGNGKWNPGKNADAFYTFGSSSDTPITGDWNGDGKDEVGIWRWKIDGYDGNGKFYLDLDGNGQWSPSTNNGEGDIINKFTRNIIQLWKDYWNDFDGFSKYIKRAAKYGAAWFEDLKNNKKREGSVDVWQIGNEDWAQLTPEFYATTIKEFSTRMKKVDSGVKLCANGLLHDQKRPDGGINDPNEWNKVILSNADHFDYICPHIYKRPPKGEKDPRNILLTLLAESYLDNEVKTQREYIEKYASNSNPSVGIYVSEYNLHAPYGDPDEYPDLRGTLAHALFLADWLKSFIRDGVQRASYHSIAGGKFGLLQFDGVKITYRPVYYVFDLYRNHFGKKVVETDTSSSYYIYKDRKTGRDTHIPYLSVLASLSKDGGKLYLMVINKNLDTDYSTSINLGSFSPSANANVYTLNGPAILSDNKEKETVKLEESSINNVSEIFEYSFPAHSITVIEFNRNNLGFMDFYRGLLSADALSTTMWGSHILKSDDGRIYRVKASNFFTRIKLIKYSNQEVEIKGRASYYPLEGGFWGIVASDVVPLSEIKGGEDSSNASPWRFGLIKTQLANSLKAAEMILDELMRLFRGL